MRQVGGRHLMAPWLGDAGGHHPFDEQGIRPRWPAGGFTRPAGPLLDVDHRAG